MVLQLCRKMLPAYIICDLITHSGLSLYTGIPSSSMTDWYYYLTAAGILGLVISKSQSGFNGTSELVKNFTCTTHNWNDYILCRWNFIYNTVPDHIDVHWQPLVWNTKWYHCPELTNTTCKWNLKEGSLAIDIERKYSILIDNGRNQSLFTVRWNESVQPDPVSNLKATPKNAMCILLEWEHSDYLHNKTFRVEYKIAHGLKEMVKMVYSEEDEIHTELCDLRPNTRYEIEVKCKPKIGMWSNTRSTTVLTDKTHPFDPPKVYIGSYSWRWTTTPTTTITVYWKILEKYQWNGDTLFYDVRVSTIEENNVITKRMDSSQFSAKFEVEKNSSYQVSIYSRNEVGESKRVSFTIPAYKDLSLAEDVYAVKNKQNRIHIYWKEAGNENITFYSIFWCERSFSDICKETPTSIQSNTTSGRVLIPGLFEKSSFLFAVSYTTNDLLTSGFIWSDCFIDLTAKEFPFGFVVTLHPIDNNIHVKWRFSKCTFVMNEDFITMYAVQICEDKNCKEHTEHNVTGAIRQTVIPKSDSVVCARVLPYWNGRKGKPSSITCIQRFDKKKFLIPVLLAVGAVFSFLSTFGCYMLIRKVKKAIKKAKQPYTITTPVIYTTKNTTIQRGESGIPLLDTR